MLADETGCRHGGDTQLAVIYVSARVPRLSLYITEGIIRAPSSRGGGRWGGVGGACEVKWWKSCDLRVGVDEGKEERDSGLGGGLVFLCVYPVKKGQLETQFFL